MNATRIKKLLEDFFHLKFQIDNQNSDLIISFAESNDSFFYVKVNVKDDIRLTIFAEPQKYGKQFVETINSSNEDKRKVFVEYWEKLGESRIKIKINDVPISSEDFIQDKKTWNSFSLRYSVSPYYEKENEKEKNIFDGLSSVIAMLLSICEYSIVGYEEGETKVTIDKKYERNPINRKLCLLAKGYKCSVCGFDFEKAYGEIGKGFIEVHHSLPVSQMGIGHIVDPIKELFPLCPNCHAMIHRKNPPYTIDELKKIMEEANENK